MVDKFNAFRIYQDKPFHAAVEIVALDDLTAGDLIIEVAYSGINYKDALAGSGKAPILRTSSLNGGIDLIGTVVESQSDQYQSGTKVIAQGSGLSERYDGGYSQYARLPAACVLPLPSVFTPLEAMTIGTAGFTAAMAIDRMEMNGQSPDQGPIIVTGASGGVGSFAVHLLAKRGYQSIAATRKQSAHDYLMCLGAAQVIPALNPISGALDKQQWGGGIDNLGGQTLAGILKTTRTFGNVVSIGLAESAMLSTSIMPFIVRGVNLLGVSSANCPQSFRKKIWQRLATDMKPDCLDKVVHSVVGLKQLPQQFEELLAGKIQGRVIVDVNA